MATKMLSRIKPSKLANLKATAQSICQEISGDNEAAKYFELDISKEVLPQVENFLRLAVQLRKCQELEAQLWAVETIQKTRSPPQPSRVEDYNISSFSPKDLAVDVNDIDLDVFKADDLAMADAEMNEFLGGVTASFVDLCI